MQRRSVVFIVVILLAALLAGCFGGNKDKYIKSDNLALEKEYFASSFYRAEYDAPYAFDGDMRTRWSAAKDHAIDQFIGVDFGEEIEYNYVRIDQDQYPRIVKYVLQYSNDGATYTDIPGTETELTLETVKSVLSISFEPIRSQYLRLYIYESIYADKGTTDPKEASINEFEVYLVTKQK